jgi:hypothetical protein
MHNYEHNLSQFEWAIPRRAKSQELMLRLYQYLGRNPQLETDADSRRTFGLLVGAGFSLWRAVCLAQPDRDWGGNRGILSGAADLLEKVLETNAVLFGDEKRIEGWSVGYYLNNAYFRLDSAIQRLPEAQMSPALSTFAQQRARGITSDSPHEIWDTGYEAASASLDMIDPLP